MYAQDCPAPLALHTAGDARLVTNYGKLIGRARNADKTFVGEPSRKRRGEPEPAHGEAFGQNGKLQSARRHRECTPSEKAFHQPPIHGNRSTADVAGPLPSKQCDRRGELLGASDAAEGS